MPEVTMPRLSDTMQEGTIARWLKKPGDQVKKGEVLAEIETDKATMDLEAYDEGVLEKVMVEEGQSAPIGQPIAMIGSGEGVQQREETPQQAEQPAEGTAAQSGATESAPAASVSREGAPRGAEGTATSEAPAPAEKEQPAPAQKEQPAQAPSEPPGHADGHERASGEFIKASPIARRMAEEHNIDLRQVHGSGPGGRIVRDDIEDYLEQRPEAPQAAPAPTAPAAQQPAAAAPAAGVPSEAVPLSRMQTIVARRLTEAKQTIPHFYVSNEIDMTEALILRKQLNESAGEEGVKVSVNDLIIKACALALEKFPEVNSSYKDGQFLRHKVINIGSAVDVPGGLVVPVVRDANLKGVRTIAREMRAYIEKARANRLAPDDLSGGTFSVSNMGMFDVSDFIAVINPPEAAILAVGSVRRRFVPIEDQPVIRDIMPVTLSADHRIIYGAGAARFLQEIKRLLQEPFNLLG